MKTYVMLSVVLVTIVPALAAPPGIERPINCTRPNEFYECGSACQTECATLGQTCPIVNIKCNDACYCIKGYARNADGDCIKISDCNKNSHCK